MVVTDAVMLGFHRTRHYFDGEVFARGDIVTLSVEGFVLDLTNTTGELSSSIATNTKNLFDNVDGQGNYNLGNGVTVNDIVINGLNFGKGRILNLESMSSSELREDKIGVGKYVFTVEFLQSLGSAVFSIDGPVGTTYYDQMETILEPYAERMESFAESFDFSKGSGGEENFSHDITIKLRDDGVSAGWRIAAPTIAARIYGIGTFTGGGSEPSFPFSVFQSGGVSQQLDDPNFTSVSTPHNAFFNESYDSISGVAKFSKRWKNFRNQEPDVHVMGNIVGQFNDFYTTIDDNRYSVKLTYSMNKTPTLESVTERCDIMRVTAARDGATGIRKTIPSVERVLEAIIDPSSAGGTNSGVGGEPNSHKRCQRALEYFSGSTTTLKDVPLETKTFQGIQDNRLGFEVTFSSDPKIVDELGGLFIDRSYNLTRDSKGVNIFTHDAKLSPILGGAPGFSNAASEKNTIRTQHTLAKLLGMLDGSSMSSPGIFGLSDSPSPAGVTAGEPGWVTYFRNAGASFLDLKRISSDLNIKPKITSLGPAGLAQAPYSSLRSSEEVETMDLTWNEVWTDDSSIMQLWSSAAGPTKFTRKQISVENTAPVKKKQTYMIAGWGEVLHASPQSEIGQLSIQFEGQVKRDTQYNCHTYGALLKETDWRTMMREAVNNCMVHFGSVVNPRNMFITDVNCSFGSDRKFSLGIVLSYTKESYIQAFEIR